MPQPTRSALRSHLARTIALVALLAGCGPSGGPAAPECTESIARVDAAMSSAAAQCIPGSTRAPVISARQ